MARGASKILDLRILPPHMSNQMHLLFAQPTLKKLVFKQTKEVASSQTHPDFPPNLAIHDPPNLPYSNHNRPYLALCFPLLNPRFPSKFLYILLFQLLLVLLIAPSLGQSLSLVCPVALCVCGYHYQPIQSTSGSEAMLVPPWLEPLLSTTFFSICQSHISFPRNECNMFCIDCSHRSAFCFYCKSIWHQHHRIIQIRRSSYHDVVRVSEIDKVLDISGVQTYVINSAKVIFLNERPQPKSNYSGKSSSHFCKICRRTLLDPFCFCSLGCKVVGIEKKMEKLGLSGKKEEEKGRRILMGTKEGEEKEFEEGTDNKEYKSKQQDARLPPLRQVCSNSRRRKGIPQRAPLGP